MNSLLIQQLIQLGTFVETSPEIAIGHLGDIYEQVNPEEAQTIHTALTDIIDRFSKMGFAQDDFRFGQRINLLVVLANIPVPGLNEQVQISSGADEIKEIINNFEKTHSTWAAMVYMLDLDKNYLRNDEACSILIDNMPLTTSNSKKKNFLRSLGAHSATAYFVAMLSSKYRLDRPYFPFDWAKNIYYLMGFHLSNPSEHILNARVDFWNTLFQLSETELPSPRPARNNN